MNDKKSNRSNQSLSILLVMILLFVLSGCTQSSSEIWQNNVHEVISDNHTITDCVGRKVKVPQSILRVAALDSFAGEALVMIGAGEKMVSAPNGVKMDRLLQKIYPDLYKVGVPMSGGTINAESLMVLHPDLILIKYAMYLQKGEVEKIEKLGVPYLVVNYTNMKEQIDALQMIGDVLGGQAKERASAINDYYRSVVERAQEISEKIPQDKCYRVYHAINEVVRTDGTDTLGYDWITCTGAINVSCGANLKFAENDYFAGVEQIFSWNPDIVICNEASTVDYLMKEPKWKGLRAVYESKVYNIPVGATRWGQRGSLETFFAILWLGTTIYPEYYGDINLKEEVLVFYKQHFGLVLDDETYQQICKGEGIRVGSNQESGKT